jgi:putative transposase
MAHDVWLYYRFCLRYRDVEELLFARDVMVSYEAIRKWCRKFGQAYANELRQRRSCPVNPNPCISSGFHAPALALPAA